LDTLLLAAGYFTIHCKFSQINLLFDTAEKSWDHGAKGLLDCTLGTRITFFCASMIQIVASLIVLAIATLRTILVFR
jgi:hypothetical protein